jgi:recombination protein RecA
MGKKKLKEDEISVEEGDSIENKQNRLRKEINDKYGEVLVYANKIANRERKVVSFSPMADHNIGSGIPEGSFVTLSGPPKCGKSVSALQICANAQQQYVKPIYIGNIEFRLNAKELEGIHGLDLTKVEMIQSTEGKILVAQDFLQEFTTIIKSVPGCILVIDSSSALCAEGEFSGEMRSHMRNDGPKLLAQFCRKMTGVVPIQKTIVIVIQHLLQNCSPYGEPLYEDGGRKLQHIVDLKLRCTSFQKWENKEKEQIGQIINWQVKTAALTKPGAKFSNYLRYGYGIDDIQETIILSMDCGIVDKSGSWLTFHNTKLQGEEKFYTHMMENPNEFQELKAELAKMVK